MNVKSKEMFVYQWFEDLDKFYNTVIRIYGVTHTHTDTCEDVLQKNICLKVINFKPYCFVEIPDNLYENVGVVRSHIKPFCASCEVVSKSHLYNSYNKYEIGDVDNLTKNEILFIKVFFKNKKNMQKMVYYLQNNDIMINGIQHRLSVHEHNSNSILQMMCNCNIDSVGWLEFGSAKPVDIEEKETICDEEYTVLWQQLKSGKNVHNIQPKTMAFDMEVTSCVPSAFPSDKPKDEIFQISCIIVDHKNITKKILLTIEPKTSSQQMVETLATESITTYMSASETDLLEKFIKIINDERPNIITGYNIFGFDIEYLIKRCSRFLLVEQLKTCGFYKNSFAKEEEIKWSSSAYKNQNFRFINWEGILLIDLLPVIQRDYKLDTYSLKNVCSTFLKNNTKDPVTHKDIFEAFNTREASALAIVGKYCVQDSLLCIDLMNCLHTWVHLCEMARCCNVPIFKIFTQGQQTRIYSQIYKYCTNNNIIVTTNGYDSIKTNERYRGALVHEPKPGFYKNVCPLDFASLYPSIIIGYNLCYSTFIPDDCVLPKEYYNIFEWEDHVGCKHDENVVKIEELSQKIEELETKIKKLRNDITSVSIAELKSKKMTKAFYKTIIQEKINLLVLQKKPLLESRQKLKKSEPKRIEDEHGNKIEGVMCAKRRYRFLKAQFFKGIVPTIIQNLLDSRAEIKNRLKTCPEQQKIILNMQQLSYKVSANSFYGSFGVTKGYLPFMPCAMTITFCGRKAITNVIDLAVNKFSAHLVMSDTDSTYLIFPENFESYENLWKRAEYVASQITNYVDGDERLFPEAIKLEFENIIYSKFLIVAKKMYLYKSTDSTGLESEKIGKKGVVLARRDNSQVVRNAYEHITHLIFDSVPVSDLMTFLKQYILDMYNNKFPIEDFVITKSVGDIEEQDDQKDCKGRLGNYKIRNILPKDEKEKQKILGNITEREYYILQCPPQVQLAERLQRRGTPVSTGSRLEFVVLHNPQSSSLGKKFECFEYFKKYKDILDLDYHYYAEALVNPITQLINAVSETDDDKVSVLIKQIIAEKKLEYEQSKPRFIYV